jgi:hypothetical protein
MHASTRVLLLLAAVVAIVVGWWILLAINNIVVAIVYGVLWTAFVLIVTRVLSAVGFGFNRLTPRGNRGPTPVTNSAGAKLAELTQLRDRKLISSEEYDAKRAKILERL